MLSRIFSALAAIAVLMILIAGIGVYWVTGSELAKLTQEKSDALAKSVAYSLSATIDTLNKILDKMAQDPEVVAAVSSNNPELIAVVSDKLERNFPDVQKIRLLLPGITELDEKSTPQMSFADLDMVRGALTSVQLPAIHGSQAADRYLSMARKIMQDNRGIGVILVSMKYDFIRKSLLSVQGNGGYFELKQDKLLLAASGAKSNSDKLVSAQYRIPETGWELRYEASDADMTELMIIAGLIGIPGIIVLACSWFGYRKLSTMFLRDLSSVLSAFKDMMRNKLPGSYPFNLSEFNIVISTLAQYKRLQNNEDTMQDSSGFGEFQASDIIFEELDLDIVKPVIHDTQAKASAVKEGSLQKIPEPLEHSNKIDENSAIFRAYDIRGIVGSALTRDVVYNIGRALGTEAIGRGSKTIALGHDGRTSSPELSASLAQGIVTTGCSVLNIGMVPTPLLYFVTHHIEGRSGVMVTGSHNPPQYNGLKMVIKGETLAGERIQKLKQTIDNQVFAVNSPGKIERNERLVNDYIGTISEDIHIARPIKVVLDCGNGVAGELGPVLLRTLGCEVIELYCEIDGTFPNHHPDPGKPENLRELIVAVKHYQADLGIAFDGDGDRLGVIDSNGKIIWPDRLMMLFAKDVLAGKPGSEIIYDVKCTRNLAGQITKYGGRPVMWKTGHSLMKAKLRETGAMLAGEMSGHIFFNDRWFGFDDALYSASRLIEILSADTRSSADVFGDLPDSINTPELNINMSEGENFTFIENFISSAKFNNGRITTIDGIRVDFPDGWGLVRASNTMPSLVIRFEAETNQALKLIQDQFRQQMTIVKPDISLPF